MKLLFIILITLFFTSANMRIVEINEDVCLLDNAMTHSIFLGKEYFTNLTLRKANVHTISGHVKIIERFGHATIILPNCTTLHLEDAFSNSRSKKNLLSIKTYAIMGTILRH